MLTAGPMRNPSHMVSIAIAIQRLVHCPFALVLPNSHRHTRLGLDLALPRLNLFYGTRVRTLTASGSSHANETSKKYCRRRPAAVSARLSQLQLARLPCKTSSAAVRVP